MLKSSVVKSEDIGLVLLETTMSFFACGERARRQRMHRRETLN
jgi:hypothetical protein